eukprot:1422112-Rhodomonas_salina.1
MLCQVPEVKNPFNPNLFCVCRFRNKAKGGKKAEKEAVEEKNSAPIPAEEPSSRPPIATVAQQTEHSGSPSEVAEPVVASKHAPPETSAAPKTDVPPHPTHFLS